MKITAALAIGAVSLLAHSATSIAKPHRYVGVHAISAEAGMCYIEAPHVHGYAPIKPAVLFRTHGGKHHFIGDPVAYGYDGPRHSYHGHHPIHVGDLGEIEDYCYLDGPHFHHHAPPVGAKFELKGDIHWYVGSFSPRYKQHLYQRKHANALYAELDYPRPVVVVEPPLAYAGVVVTAPGAHVAVVAPNLRPGVSADVNVLLPAFAFEIGGHDHGHAHGKHKHKYKYKDDHGRHRVKRHKKAHKRHNHSRGRRWKF